MKKSRLSVYLDKPVLDALAAYAGRRNQSLSLVAEAAILSFVSPEQSTDSLLRRFNRLDKQLQRLERDTQISAEALMVFVWVWFTANPPLPQTSETAARAAATQRYDAFMETLGQRLARSSTAHSRADDSAVSDLAEDFMARRPPHPQH